MFKSCPRYSGSPGNELFALRRRVAGETFARIFAISRRQPVQGSEIHALGDTESADEHDRLPFGLEACLVLGQGITNAFSIGAATRLDP
jgi:hypothetical protein